MQESSHEFQDHLEYTLQKKEREGGRKGEGQKERRRRKSLPKKNHNIHLHTPICIYVTKYMYICL